jgi:hypothetical protein
LQAGYRAELRSSPAAAENADAEALSIMVSVMPKAKMGIRPINALRVTS